MIPILTIREGDDAGWLAAQFCERNHLTVHHLLCASLLPSSNAHHARCQTEGCAKVTDIAHKSVQVKITNRPTGGTLPDRNPGASPDELRHRYGDFYRQMWYTPSTACSARNCGCAAAAPQVQDEEKCWPASASRPTDEKLQRDLQRLRKRTILFGMTQPDPGPPFLGRFFGHFYRCLACDVQAQADRNVHTGDQVEVGFGRQVFADDWVIANACNVKHVLGEGKKEPEPLLRADQSFEDDRTLFYGSVLHIGDRFRMWYLAFTGVQAIAESFDGLNWAKPALDVMPAQSIMPAHMESQTKAVWVPNPSNIIGHLGISITVSTDPVHGECPASSVVPSSNA